jgi:hypothetical protein
MQTSKLDRRMRLTIEMALTGNQGSPALIQRQDEAAARLGMCGAEIDAARAGRSFDLRGSRALELALAAKGSERGELRQRAIQAGFDEEDCCEIERLAAADALEGAEKHRG